MKTHVRFLFVIAALVLVAGWLGLHRSNAALELRLAGDRPAAAGEGTP